MLLGSNYVTHLLTLLFRGAICTLNPTINSIVDLATRELRVGHQFCWQIRTLLSTVIVRIF